MSNLIRIPAGRSFRRDGSKFIDSEPTRGAIEVHQGDEFLEFKWVNSETGGIEDELIIFPGEASFSKVSQDPSGRTHVLSFSSSNQKHFFWFQRASTANDARDYVDLNEILQNPEYTLGSAPLPSATEPSASAHAPEAASSSVPESSSSGGNQEQMARLVAEWARSGGLSRAGPEDGFEETDLALVLSPVNIAALIASKPELIPTITALLPPGIGLSENPTIDEMTPICTAPQFQDALGSLDTALRNGGLPGSMMRELGLPESAGANVGAFLNALADLAEQGDGAGAGTGGASDAMDTD